MIFLSPRCNNLDMFTNPVIPGFAPDPSVTFHNGFYYLVNSTFEYFPGITVWKSPDLVSWSYLGSVLNKRELVNLDKASPSSGLYAATIRTDARGRFYVVTTNKFTLGNFVVHTDDIESGLWSSPAFICRDGIDPSLLFLPDGRCFYSSNGKADGKKGIVGAFINPDSGELLEPLRLLTEGCGGASVEGPHIYMKDGWYYLMEAEGGTEYGHHEVILRSRNIYGPYEENPRNPILSHVSRKRHPIQATGHADLIEDREGKWWAVFLAIRVKPRPLLHHLGRETFLAPVEWKEGWPVIGDEGKVELEYENGPDAVEERDYSVSFRDDLEKYPYLKVRVPKNEAYTQDKETGLLRLHGEENINVSLGHPTMLLFRQRGFSERMRVTLDTESLTGKAGITVFLSSDYHYRLEVTAERENIRVALIRHIHDFEAVTESISMKRDRPCMTLEIRSDDENYFFFADGTGIGSATVYALAAEGSMTMCFTGSLFGIYAAEGDAVFIDGITMESIEKRKTEEK